MARSDRHFKATFNTSLDLFKAGASFISNAALARALSVSRAMATQVAEKLNGIGILSSSAPPYVSKRKPRKSDYFEMVEALSTKEAVQFSFMNWVVAKNISPGAKLSEAHLAEQLNVSTTTIREFLIHLSRFGFVRKIQNRSWVLEGFTKQYAIECHEVRIMFEVRAVNKVCKLPITHEFWEKLQDLKEVHLGISEETDFQKLDFAALDAQFHRLINSSAGNRFIEDFQETIALIFHYHFLWNNDDIVFRNVNAAQNHLAIIDAIQDRDPARAEAAMLMHIENTDARFRIAIDG